MAAETPLRLLIAEDHATLRAALGMFFSERDNIEVVGQAADSAETLRLHQQLHPHIILLGTDIHPIKILELIGQLCDENADTQIVILTSSMNEIPFEKFKEAGATTVVEEGIFASNLFEVIEQVYRQA